MAIEVSQHGLEVARQDAAPLVRVTQAPVEVLRQADAPLVRASQVPVEVLRSSPPTQNVRLSQGVVEVARLEPISAAWLSQLVLEVSRPGIPEPKLGLASWMVFDKIHSLDVRMFTGFPPSTAPNDLAVLNGANVALLGSEIIQWVNSTDLGNNAYRLTRLLRGRLGTELFMNAHTSGELFVILDPASIRRVVQNPNDANAQRFLKIIGAGLPSYSATVTPFVNTGFSQKPWKASQVRSARDGPGEITITWYRRTRINYEWLDFVDVPLGESDERYEVDILNGAGTVVRTLEITTTTAVYTVADQTTDFGGIQSKVAVRIYQLSNLLGRGQAASAIV